MIHIYTFCDKTLIGRKNLSAKFLCENLYKLNLRIDEVCIFPSDFDYASLNYKNSDIYFLLMQKSSLSLNSSLSNLLGNKIEENLTLKQAVHDFYQKSNIAIDKECEIEYNIPQGAQAIANFNGKTQGYRIKIDKTEIFVLPCDELQFRHICNNFVLGYLEDNFAKQYVSETYKCFGITEQNLKSNLSEFIKNNDKIKVSFFSNGLECDVVIKCESGNEKFEEYRRKIYSTLEKNIYSVYNKSLSEELNDILKDKALKISFIGDYSVCNILQKFNNPLCNNKLGECQVFFDKHSVELFLNNKNVFVQNNAVSAEVIYELVVKMLEKSNCDLVVASILDSSGLSYVALGNKNKIDIYKNKFVGSVEEIMSNVSNIGLLYLINKLKSGDYKLIK